MIVKSAAQLFARDILSVQKMTAPTGKVFGMRIIVDLEEDLKDYRALRLSVTYPENAENLAKKLISLIHSIVCSDSEENSAISDQPSSVYWSSDLRYIRKVYFHTGSLKEQIPKLTLAATVNLVNTNACVRQFMQNNKNSGIEWKLFDGY